MPTEPSSDDIQWMSQALLLGERGRLTAPPNPWVGCMIVKEGCLVGEGYHVRPGEPHAEVNALRLAGPQAHGSTVYSTLEPCSHHGRTAPCAEALIEARVARVVVALQDPDPRVAGKGLALLKNAGIEVSLGICAEAAELSLKPYLHHRHTGRPYCVVKMALSLDGRIAAQDGSSKWITSSEARIDVHRLRAESQGIIVGSGTALKDNPSLTSRDWKSDIRQPHRVLLDAMGRVPAQGPLFNSSLAPTIVFTTEKANRTQVQTWRDAGCDVERIHPASQGVGVDLKEMLQRLGNRGIVQVLVEGGASVYSSFLNEGLIDKLVVYYGDCLLGDLGRSAFIGLPLDNIDQAPRFILESVTQLGSSARHEYARNKTS